MVEPGNIIETSGMVPLRFVVMETDLSYTAGREDLALFCTARQDTIFVVEDEFIELEDATVMEMTKGQIKEELDYETAKVADFARQAYLNGTGDAEVL